MDGERYRYRLSRSWQDELREPAPPALFVMLNPSTADEVADDPTIRRCVGFARSWGCGGLQVVNLYGLRSTDPAGLRLAHDPIGPANGSTLEEELGSGAHPVVCAWGRSAEPARVSWFLDLAARLDVRLHCLGRTQDGHPRHPLYVRRDTQPVAFC